MEPCHTDTNKSVGRHFRLPGHDISHMKMLPIEKVSEKEPFLRKAREGYFIKLFQTQKKLSVLHIEHSLNVKKGQL